MKTLKTDYDEYRSWPQWYYHLIFDSFEKGQIFNNRAEYAQGMNGIAIGQYLYDLAIVAFNLMINHCHILAYGSGENMVRFFIFMKRRINGCLKDDGYPLLPEDYGFKLVRVEDKRQLADTIVYIARNPLKACPTAALNGYIWGSTHLIFNEMKDLYERKPLGELSTRGKRHLLRSGVSLPDDYSYNEKYGFIMPDSYVLNSKAEQVFERSWNYFYGIVRNIDGYLRIAEGLGEEVILSEDELNDVISQTLRKMFKVSSVNELTPDDRCRLAMVLKTRYKVTIKRIARKLHMDIRILRKLFE